MYRHATLFVILITFLTFNVLYFSISSAEEDYSVDVHITEFIPNPVGNDSELEFIELYNGSDFDVDLSGWVVDTGGSARFTISSGTILGAQSFLTFYSADKNMALTNSGDRIQFIRPNAVVQDDIVYASSIEGHSYIRLDAGIYGGSATPTPNSANTPLPTPIVTPTPTPAIAPTPTPSESPTPILYSTEVHVSEFLPSPEGDDGELEFIELHNSSISEIDISGWIIDTGPTSRFTIASGTVIAPGLYVVFFSSAYDISLSNSSDRVQFIKPDGVVQDDILYTTTKEGHSYNRSDAGVYDQSFTPTANAANTITASPTPSPKPIATTTPKPEKEHVTYDFSSRLVINELLPNPDGSDEEYEFIEIKNMDKKTVRLAGWTLNDTAKGSGFHFADESILAGKILVFERKKTKIALNNDTDTVSLVDPSGKIISSVTYSKVVPEGQSWNRAVNGTYAWSETPTAGKENTIVVLEKTSPTPRSTSLPDRQAGSGQAKPKKARVAAVKKKASASAQVSELRAPSVLAARDEKLPWAEAVSNTVVSSSNETLPASGRQRLFVLFGATAAFAQLASGISRKERIWRM